jgi:hypothetical protein
MTSLKWIERGGKHLYNLIIYDSWGDTK